MDTKYNNNYDVVLQQDNKIQDMKLKTITRHDINYGISQIHVLTMQILRSVYMPITYLGYMDGFSEDYQDVIIHKLMKVQTRLESYPQVILMYVIFGEPEYEHEKLSAIVVNTSDQAPTFEIFAPFSLQDYQGNIKTKLCQIMKSIKYELQATQIEDTQTAQKAKIPIPESRLSDENANEQCLGSVPVQKAGLYKITIKDEKYVDMEIVQLNLMVFWLVCHRGLVVHEPKYNPQPWTYTQMSHIFESEKGHVQLAQASAMWYHETFQQMQKLTHRTPLLEDIPNKTDAFIQRQFENIRRFTGLELHQLPWLWPHELLRTNPVIVPKTQQNTPKFAVPEHVRVLFKQSIQAKGAEGIEASYNNMQNITISDITDRFGLSPVAKFDSEMLFSMKH